jgi:transposase
MQEQGRKRRGNKETTLAADQRVERLQRVAKLYLAGKSALDIARTEGVNRQAIYDDIRRLRKIWWNRNNRAADKIVAEQVAKLDRAEQAAWEGWERSCLNSEETTTESGEKQKVTTKVKGQSGDPQFLAVISRLIDQRCKLLKIGQYATEDSGVMVGMLVEVVVENTEQINRIMDFGDFQKLSDGSNVVDGEVLSSNENQTDPD